MERVEYIMNNLKNIYNDLKLHPYKYSFIQACFILEQFHTDKINFGDGIAKYEPIKLTPYISASTPFSSCIKFDSSRKNFLINAPALLGFNGILPHYYSEKIFFQERQANFILSDFFNIFQHRFFSLKYKIEKCYSTNIQSTSKFEEVFCISGINNNAFKSKLSPFFSILIMRSKTKNNLKILLENLIQTDIIVNEFHSKWFDIPEKHQLKMDYSLLTEKALGTKTKINHSAIEIVFLFANFEKYMIYLNNKDKQQEINAILKYFFNGELNFSIKLQIRKHTSQTFCLNSQNQLGLTTWL